MKRTLLLLLPILLLWNCRTAKQPIVTDFEYRELDTMVVRAPRVEQPAEEFQLKRYNPSAKRDWDLLHTKLDLRFDWEKEKDREIIIDPDPDTHYDAKAS